MTEEIVAQLVSDQSSEETRSTALRRITDLCSDEKSCVSLVESHPTLIQTLFALCDQSSAFPIRSSAIQAINNICRTRQLNDTLHSLGVAARLTDLMGGDSALVEFFTVQALRQLTSHNPELIAPTITPAIDKVVVTALFSRVLRFNDGQTLWIHIEATRLLATLIRVNNKDICDNLATTRGFKPVLEHLARSKHPIMRGEASAALATMAPAIAKHWDRIMEHDHELIVSATIGLAVDEEALIRANGVTALRIFVDVVGGEKVWGLMSDTALKEKAQGDNLPEDILKQLAGPPTVE